MPCWRLGSGEAPIPPTILQVVPSGLVLLAMLLEASQRLICTLPENQKTQKNQTFIAAKRQQKMEKIKKIKLS